MRQLGDNLGTTLILHHLLGNVLVVSKRKDQTGVLLHVEQEVVQVEHQQLDAFLTESYKYDWCRGLQRKAEVCRSPERSICEHLSKLGEQSQKVNRPVNTTGNQAGLLRKTLSALFENVVQCLWWGQTMCGPGVESCLCVGRTKSPA